MSKLSELGYSGEETQGGRADLSPPTFTTGGAEPPHFSYMTYIGHHKMLSGGACPKQDNQETKVSSLPTFNLLSPPLLYLNENAILVRRLAS